jgi:hypothetical protein
VRDPLESLEIRMGEFLAGWPRPLAQEFARYREGLRRGASAHAAWGQSPPLPYWMRLPVWIAGESARSVAAEALWGGYCLFYPIRIQDDLFDGQLDRSILAHVPALFLAECQRTFGRLFPWESEFWELFRRSVNSTTSGIATVAGLQRDLHSSPLSLLEQYGKVD